MIDGHTTDYEVSYTRRLICKAMYVLDYIPQIQFTWNFPNSFIIYRDRILHRTFERRLADMWPFLPTSICHTIVMSLKTIKRCMNVIGREV